MLFFDTGIPVEKIVAAHVAQLAEHILGKDEVSGSIPLMGSKSVAHGKLSSIAGLR